MKRICDHQSAAAPHRSYLQPGTWELQRQVAAIRRSLHRLQHRICFGSLALYFAAWRDTKVSHSAQEWRRQADRSMAAHVATLKSTGLALRKACKQDRDAYISRLAQQLSSGPSSETFANLHAMLGHRRRKAYQADPLPAIKQADGRFCPDAQAVVARWRQHFGSMEGGEELDLATLAQKWECTSGLLSPWLPVGPTRRTFLQSRRRPRSSASLLQLTPEKARVWMEYHQNLGGSSHGYLPPTSTG